MLIDSQQSNIPLNISIDEKTEQIRSYAKSLSASLSSSSLRNRIKTDALEMYDGDFDILVLNLHKETKSFPDYLSADQLSFIQNYLPNLQVSVPVHCEEWDPNTYIPLVAYLPYDYDEHIATEVEAYDVDGNIHYLSLDTEPDMPVIVVSMSERVSEVEALSIVNNCPTTKSEANIPVVPTGLQLAHCGARQLELSWTDGDTETGYYIYRKSQYDNDYSLIDSLTLNRNYYIDSYLSSGIKYSYRVRSYNSSGVSSFSPAISTFASSRSDGELLRINRMYFTKQGLQNVEKWASGAPEIRLRVVVSDANSARTYFTSGILEPARRSDISETWWEYSVDICTWYTGVIGTVLTFDWREEDPSSSASFQISGSYEDKLDNATVKVGGSVSFTLNEGKDHIGQTTVFWWEPKGKIYDLGGFKWQFSS